MCLHIRQEYLDSGLCPKMVDRHEPLLGAKLIQLCGSEPAIVPPGLEMFGIDPLWPGLFGSPLQ